MRGQVPFFLNQNQVLDLRPVLIGASRPSQIARNLAAVEKFYHSGITIIEVERV